MSASRRGVSLKAIKLGGITALVCCPSLLEKWTLWQYTDGGVGPHPHAVDGIGPCDRDMFNGTRKQLKNWWGT
jgi:hypothetical protein